MNTKQSSSSIPAHLQREIKTSMAEVSIRLSLARDQLQYEKNEERIKKLQTDIERIKAEARSLIGRYKWAKDVYDEAIGIDEVAASFIEAIFPQAQSANSDDTQPEQQPAPAPPPTSDPDPVWPTRVNTGDLTGHTIPGVVDATDRRGDGHTSTGETDARMYTDSASSVAKAPRDETRAGGEGLVIGEVEIALHSIGDVTTPMRHTLLSKGGRLGEALSFAAENLVRNQRLGRPSIPMSLLLGAAGLAAEYGEGDDDIIAAVLIGTVDSSSDEETIQEMRDAFGDPVVNTVEYATRLVRIDPWEQRDRSYIESIQNAPESALRVAVCYRLAAISTLTRDLRLHGKNFWARIPIEKDRLLWSYRMIVKSFATISSKPLLTEFTRVTAEFESLSS